jgi:hypothetical protein
MGVKPTAAYCTREMTFGVRFRPGQGMAQLLDLGSDAERRQDGLKLTRSKMALGTDIGRRTFMVLPHPAEISLTEKPPGTNESFVAHDFEVRRPL